MNNYEKIKNMTMDEMVEFIHTFGVNCCACAFFRKKICDGICILGECKVGHRIWLQQESEV